MLGAIAATAHAEAPTIAGNFAVTSQHVFRGLTQTNERPAVQGGPDAAHASGLYAGIRLSNVNWFSDTFGVEDSEGTDSVDLQYSCCRLAAWKPRRLPPLTKVRTTT